MAFIMKPFVIILSLSCATISQKLPDCPENEKVCKTVADISEQLLKSFKNHLRDCVEKTNKGKEKDEDFEFLVWDKFGDAQKVISKDKEDAEEVVIISDDPVTSGSHLRSNLKKVKKIAKKIKEKKPSAKVISIDWSKYICKDFIKKHLENITLEDIANACKEEGKFKKAAKKLWPVIKEFITSNETRQIIFPILKGAAIEILKVMLTKYNPKVATIIATLLNPSSEPGSPGKRSRGGSSLTRNGAFIGVMHTSDILGDPESRLGNVDVYANGGRLQPGCYDNQSRIDELGNALKCSSDRVWDLYYNSLTTEYKSRACKCWDFYRLGRCKDKLSNYMGNTDKIRTDSFRYYVRTDEKGGSIGDTSDQNGNPNDFVFKFDETCSMEGSMPPREVDDESSSSTLEIGPIFEMTLLLLVSFIYQR